jgi:hypothetical protein
MSSIESNKKNPEQVKVCPTLIKWAGFAIQQHRQPLKLDMLLEVMAGMKELEEVGWLYRCFLRKLLGDHKKRCHERHPSIQLS